MSRADDIREGRVPYFTVADAWLANAYVRQGGAQRPALGIGGDYTASRFASELYPNTMMVGTGQASLPGLTAVKQPTGCDNPTGAELPVALPYLVAQSRDYLGFPVPFSPQAGESYQTTLSAQGNPVISYQITDKALKNPKRMPPMADIYGGPAVGVKAYGTYRFKIVNDDGSVTQYEANVDPQTGLIAPDKKVNKPEVYLMFSPDHFYVDEKTNELNLLADSSGPYRPGANIVFLPGVPPDTAPTITMTVGGTMEDGTRRWAYSWIIPKVLDPATGLRADADTDLSPTASGTAGTVSGTSYASADIDLPAKPIDSTVSGIKIWRTKVGEDQDNLYLAGTITTGLTAPQTFSDFVSDASLGAQHVLVKTRIAVEDWLLQNADPPTSIHTPAAPLTLGTWGQRKDLSGYAYADGNGGSLAFIALDADHKADILSAYSRATGAGAITATSLWNIAADWTKTDVDGNKPIVSQRMNGIVRADGGVQTIVLDHSPPVDADIPWPASWGAIKDGLTAICTNDNSVWERSSGTWHRLTLPVGGTTGQALAKVSGTDYDVNWQTISGGGGGGGGGGVGVTVIEDVLATVVNLPTAGVQVKVCQIDVPAGTWVIMANVLAMQNVNHSTFIAEQSGGGTPNVYFDMHVEAVSSSLYQEETVYQNDAGSPIAMSIATKVTLPVADTISLWVDCQYADGQVLANHNQTNLLAIGGSAAGAGGVALITTGDDTNVTSAQVTAGLASGFINWSTPANNGPGGTFDHSFDTGGYYDPAHPDRLTIQTDGIYEVSCSVGWLVNANSVMGVASINKNGNQIADFNEILESTVSQTVVGSGTTGSGYYFTDSQSFPFVCAAGDYFKVEWFLKGQIATGDFVSQAGCWFYIKQIG